MPFSKLPTSSFSRRDFAKLGALGLAAHLAPNLASASSAIPQSPASPSDPALTPPPVPLPWTGKPVGYAIIGLGRISDQFMAGVAQTKSSKITGLVSGHPEKAATIAAKYGVPKSSIYSYEEMDKMRDNKDIDATYIGLPNSMHAEYTIRSAKAGKHVLCEKPMCTTVKEGEQMIDACKAANVKLMIAYRLHFEPTNLHAIELLRSGYIGPIQSIQSSYGFSCGPSDWRLKKALSGGGPLMDVGIYCLNASRYLTGEEPSEFSAYAYSDPNDPRFKEVEGSLSWITRFPSGILVSSSTTYAGFMDGMFHVVGGKGWIEAKPAYNYDKLRLTGMSITSGEFDQPNPEKNPTHFIREADHFSDCVRNNKTPKTPGEEGLQDMKYITQIYKSAGIQMNG